MALVKRGRTLVRLAAGLDALARRLPGFSEPRFALAKQLVLFVLVGILNTGVGYLIYFVCIHAGLAPRYALVVGTILGVLFNYFSTGRVVFKNHVWGPFIKYLLVQAAIYFGNVVLLEWLIRLGLGPLLAQVFCLPFVVISGFLLLRFIVFRRAAASPMVGKAARSD